MGVPLRILGQSQMKLTHGKKEVIKFEKISNQIFIPVTLNGVDLTFLLDTGVGEVLLFSHEVEGLDLPQLSTAKFSGIGDGEWVEGLKSEGNTLEIGKKIKINKLTAYVIPDERINLSAYVGIPVHGIIGYEFFKDLPVEINYRQNKITVFANRKKFERKANRGKSYPIKLYRRKPYGLIELEREKKTTVIEVLIDMGYGGALLLFPSPSGEMITNQPAIREYLGRGFNGEIHGIQSRVKEIGIAGFRLKHPLYAVPDSSSLNNFTQVPGVKGSIGSEVLRRFKVYVDYSERKFYLRKNLDFKKGFYTDMSGLDISHEGLIWEKEKIEVPIELKSKSGESYVLKAFRYETKLVPNYVVIGVREDSPAAQAGIQVGDRIVVVNGRKADKLSLLKLLTILKSAEARTIKMEVLRGEESYNFKFHLKDRIPYQSNP